MININVVSASVRRPFTEAVQDVCAQAKGQPCTYVMMWMLEAQLNTLAREAWEARELTNIEPPTAAVYAQFNPHGMGMILKVVWNEQPDVANSAETSMHHLT